MRNCITKGTKGKSHIKRSMRRPTTLKQSTHTTTIILVIADTYTALTTHLALAGRQCSMGLSHFYMTCEQRH